MPHITLLFLALVGGANGAAAQRNILASVPSSEASVAGAVMSSGGRSLLAGSNVITTIGGPAHVTLWRGGQLLVCRASAASLESPLRLPQLVGNSQPLQITLHRGSFELRMPITADDLLTTPNFRISTESGRHTLAPLDVTLRVLPGGGTCIQNRGKRSPTLFITDGTHKPAYQLKAQEQVFFDHGILQMIATNEDEPCGCPPKSADELSLKQPPPTTQILSRMDFPFPASSPTTDIPMPQLEAPGARANPPITGTLIYSPNAEENQSPGIASSPAAPPSTASASFPVKTAPVPERPRGLFSRIAAFFRRIF